MNELPVGPVSSAPSNVMTYVPLETQSDWDSGRGLSASYILGTLRRRKWTIIGVTALALGAMAYLLSREERLYRASALIRLSDPRLQVAEALGSEGTGQRSAKAPDPRVSEVMVLTSPAILEQVVDREGLRLFSALANEPASFVEDVRIDLPEERSHELELVFGEKSMTVHSAGQVLNVPYGKPVSVNGIRFTVTRPRSKPASLVVLPRASAAAYVAKHLSTTSVKDTDGIQIHFVSGDPKMATRIVNTAVQAYEEVNITNAREQTTRRREFLEHQLGENDSLLRLAQSTLGSLRGGTQTYSAGAKFGSEQANLMQVEIRREELKANRSMYESVLRTLESSLNTGSSGNMSVLLSTPGIATNPVIGNLHSRLIGYQAARDEAITGEWALAPTHPDVQRYNALIASTEQQLMEAVRSQISALDIQITALGRLSARAAGEISRLPAAEAQEVRLLDQIETLRSVGSQLRTAYENARMEEAVKGGQIKVVHLASGATAIQANAPMKLMLGLLLGLMLGSGIAFIRETMDKAIHRPEQIDRLLQVPSLAIIPHIAGASRKGVLRRLLPGANGKNAGKDKMKLFDAGLDTEAFRILRTNLLFSKSTQSLKRVVVTSAAPKEGKTVTATKLAIACARQGLRTLLVDGDLRSPSLARIFSTPEEPGLASALLKRATPADVILESGVEGLEILPTTASPLNAPELLGGATMRALMEYLSERYDIIIVDSPPLLVAADAAILGTIADGVLLVVRVGVTDRGTLQLAMDQLTAVEARVLGVVLNDPNSVIRRYGGSKHYYAYSAYSEGK